MIGLGLGIHRKRRTSTAPVIPVLVSAETAPYSTTDIYLTFDQTMDESIIPDWSCFTIKCNGNVVELPNVEYYMQNLDLYLSTGNFAYSDIITISYTAPALNPLQGVDGRLVESFVDYPVTNNIAFTPAYINAKMLFWGKVSEIAAGKMPNKVTGATDVLTVGGSEGTYTFQCPDTAPYIAADTDYIWFKTDETLRTVTEAELVGYDFPRTLVKYDNTTPYAIREIIILLDGATLTTAEENLLRDYMELSIWWSDILSDHGVVKGNRGVGQSIWGIEYPSILADGNTIAWYDALDLTTITKDGSNLVSQWNDKLAGGKNLTATGTQRPTWSATGILANGTTNTMKKTPVTQAQPIFIYAVLRQKSWTSLSRLCSMVGSNDEGIGMTQYDSSPKFSVYAGNTPLYLSLTLDQFGIIRLLFNGASSKAILNNDAPVTGNAGAWGMGVITLFSWAAQDAQFANIEIADFIIRKAADNSTNEASIYNYLKIKHSL
jgi:hypothetical protein